MTAHHRTRFPLVLLAALLLTLAGLGETAAQDNRGGLTTVLRKDVRLTLRELPSGNYDLLLAPTVQATHRVVDVGPDWVALEEILLPNQTWIPVSSIRSVKIVRFGRPPQP